MKIYYYLDQKVDKKAWESIDNKEEFQILISGWKVIFIKNALPHFIDIYNKTFDNHFNKIYKVLMFSIWGSVSPTLWGILNHALLAETGISYQEKEQQIIVYFASEEKGNAY